MNRLLLPPQVLFRVGCAGQTCVESAYSLFFYSINTFTVFHFLCSNLRYVSLFELFIANNVTSQCIVSFQQFIYIISAVRQLDPK